MRAKKPLDCGLLSLDETVLYVADGEPRPGERRELRAYPIGTEGTVGHPAVLHTHL